ncbi:protein boule-like isoform X2 [Strongylocentrotus purpuratus]|uniref:RRM domain-containing protein n=1 Tax=Strongylocentrotus purpuratus TaxID=7668 RepID=A0A7M7T2K7_STRPU|nr:protein boule-like isoform X2 [Strongylocentrotus purpuratus]XP_030849189.1 protein boule-like isoform X2 [Strongylocentrotus purpuratus]
MNMSESQSSPTLESAGSSQAPSPVTGAPNAPRYGTIIPNRIFVGGIAFNTSDAELRNFFSAFGHVKEAKIIADRAGVSKGYGFITFETPEEAHRILKDQANCLVFKEKKLNIGQAIRKQPLKYPKDVDPALIPSGMVFHSPSGGYSYTYHNGVAYFNPSDAQAATHGHPGHPVQTTIAAHHHHQQQAQPQYAPYTVPFMLPPPTPQQYMTNQHQQFAYQQPQPVRQPAPQYQTQWRWVPAQAPSAAAVNGGMLPVSPLYPNPPQPHSHEVIYQQAHHYQTQEIGEVPIMEPSAAEGTTVVQTADHMPTQVISRHQPYLGTTELQQATYTTSYDPNTIPTSIVQKVTPKFTGKRPIKMPRRGDRAVKTIRTDIPGQPCTSPMGYPTMMMAAPPRMDEALMMNLNSTAHMGVSAAHMAGPAHMVNSTHMGNATHITGGGDN